MRSKLKILSMGATAVLALATVGCRSGTEGGSFGGQQEEDRSGSLGGQQEQDKSGSFGGGDAQPGQTGQGSSLGGGGGSSQAQVGQELQGTVTKTGSDQITIRTQQGEERQFKADDNTIVIMQGQDADDVSKIQEGSQVRASFSGEGDDSRLTRIEVVGDAQGSGSQGGAQGSGSQGGAQGSGSQGGSF